MAIISSYLERWLHVNHLPALHESICESYHIDWTSDPLVSHDKLHKLMHGP